MRNAVQLFGAVALLGATIACGSTPAARATMTQETAAAMSAVAPAAVQMSVQSLSQGAPASFLAAKELAIASGKLPASAVSVLRAQAIVVTPSRCGDDISFTDSDGDGYPADWSYDFDCVQTSETTTVTLTGRVSASDTNDNDPRSGFSSDVDVTLRITDSSDPAVDIIMDIDYAISVAHDSGTYTVANTFAFGLNGVSLSFNVHMAYTPDDDLNSDDFDSGTLDFDGGFNFSDGSNLYALDMQGFGLHIDETCATSIDAGSLGVADTAGNELTINYSGCDNLAVTYNGSAL